MQQRRAHEPGTSSQVTEGPPQGEAGGIWGPADRCAPRPAAPPPSLARWSHTHPQNQLLGGQGHEDAVTPGGTPGVHVLPALAGVLAVRVAAETGREGAVSSAPAPPPAPPPRPRRGLLGSPPRTSQRPTVSRERIGGRSFWNKVEGLSLHSLADTPAPGDMHSAPERGFIFGQGRKPVKPAQRAGPKQTPRPVPPRQPSREYPGARATVLGCCCGRVCARPRRAVLAARAPLPVRGPGSAARKGRGPGEWGPHDRQTGKCGEQGCHHRLCPGVLTGRQAEVPCAPPPPQAAPPFPELRGTLWPLGFALPSGPTWSV